MQHHMAPQQLTLLLMTEPNGPESEESEGKRERERAREDLPVPRSASGRLVYGVKQYRILQ